MCARCDEGFCRRHMTSTMFWLDFNPYYETPREEERERENTDLSRVEFRSLFEEAA